MQIEEEENVKENTENKVGKNFKNCENEKNNFED